MFTTSLPIKCYIILLAGLVHGKVDEIACGNGLAVDENFVVFVGGRFGVARTLGVIVEAVVKVVVELFKIAYERTVFVRFLVFIEILLQIYLVYYTGIKER